MLTFLLVLAVALYLGIATFLFLAQDRIIFPITAVGPPPPLPPRSERLELRVDGGAKLVGIHIAPTERTVVRPVMLGFGGNAWNGDAVALYLHELYPDMDVIAFHFRGYPPSEGTPSAAALLEDAPAIYDLVAKRFPGRPIVAVGFSIGSGVAAHLARQRSLAGLILVTPFDSMAALGRDRLPWLPVGLLLRHDMAVADELRAVSVPVVIITAGDDEIVPPARSAALANAVPRLVLNRAIAGAGHNDIYHAPAFREAMETAADSLR